MSDALFPIDFSSYYGRKAGSRTVPSTQPLISELLKWR